MNCGYGRGFSVLEVLDSVDRVTNLQIERRLMPRRAGDPPALVADNSPNPRNAALAARSATISTRSSPTRWPGSASSPSAASRNLPIRPIAEGRLVAVARRRERGHAKLRRFADPALQHGGRFWSFCGSMIRNTEGE